MKKTVDEFYNNIDPFEIYPESRDYLSKYWLNEKEYVSDWKPIQDSIFDPKVELLQDRLFLPEFQLMSLLGGSTFVEKDFLLLQGCMRVLGEKYFVVIENYAYTCATYKDYEHIPPALPLKFKYPIEVIWKEIYTGDHLTKCMTGWGGREFYVFGASGLWGKYAANYYSGIDINPPGFGLAILGFKEACAALFREKFHSYMTNYQKKETMYSLSSPSLHPAYKEYKAHLY